MLLERGDIIETSAYCQSHTGAAMVSPTLPRAARLQLLRALSHAGTAHAPRGNFAEYASPERRTPGTG
jgi:hypothetical protein